jgi:hypothetical protein
VKVDDYYEKIGDLLEDDVLADMTQWEYDFVMSLADYEDKRRALTPLQMEKVEELHSEYCS